MSEQLALEECFAQSPHIHGNEDLFCLWGLSVECTGNKLFACSILSKYQDVGICFCDLADAGEDILYRFAFSDKVMEGLIKVSTQLFLASP
jgi:hypothetical protein